MKVKTCPTCGERWWSSVVTATGATRFRTAGGCCRNATGRQSHAAFPGGEPPIARITWTHPVLNGRHSYEGPQTRRKSPGIGNLSRFASAPARCATTRDVLRRQLLSSVQGLRGRRPLPSRVALCANGSNAEHCASNRTLLKLSSSVCRHRRKALAGVRKFGSIRQEQDPLTPHASDQRAFVRWVTAPLFARDAQCCSTEDNKHAQQRQGNRATQRGSGF